MSKIVFWVLTVVWAGLTVWTGHTNGALPLIISLVPVATVAALGYQTVGLPTKE